MKIDYTDPRNHDIDCLFAMKLGPCDSGCEPKEASPAILDQQEIDALSQRVKDLEHALGLMIEDARSLRQIVDVIGHPSKELNDASQKVWDTAGFCLSVLGRHNPGDELTAPDRHDP